VLRERRDEARRLLALGHRKSEIKRALRERFGPLSARTIERYLGDARRRLVEEAGGSGSNKRRPSRPA
jgi:hypothetical protein